MWDRDGYGHCRRTGPAGRIETRWCTPRCKLAHSVSIFKMQMDSAIYLLYIGNFRFFCSLTERTKKKKNSARSPEIFLDVVQLFNFFLWNNMELWRAHAGRLTFLTVMRTLLESEVWFRKCVRKKIADRSRKCNSEWIEKYFFVKVIGKATCLDRRDSRGCH